MQSHDDVNAKCPDMNLIEPDAMNVKNMGPFSRKYPFDIMGLYINGHQKGQLLNQRIVYNKSKISNKLLKLRIEYKRLFAMTCKFLTSRHLRIHHCESA